MIKFKISNKIKSMMAAVFATGMLLSVGATNAYAAESTEIESGIYTVENDVYHEQEIGMAMSRNFLEPTMEVEVTKKKIVYTVGFIPSEYINNYRMKLNGEEVPVEVEEGEDSIKVTIEVDKVDADMEAIMYVTEMGRDVEFNVIPKIDTLTLVEAIEESNLNTIVIVAVAGVVIIGVVAIIVIKKKEK